MISQIRKLDSFLGFLDYRQKTGQKITKKEYDERSLKK